MEDAHIACLNLRVLAESESMKRLRLAGLEGCRRASSTSPSTALSAPPSPQLQLHGGGVEGLSIDGLRAVDEDVLDPSAPDLLNDSVDSVAALYPAEALTLVDGMSLFGVFDGHGGKEVSLFVKKVFAEELLSLDALQRGEVAAALKESFHHVDEMLEDPVYDSVLKQFRKLPNPSDRIFPTSSSGAGGGAPPIATASVTMADAECTALALVHGDALTPDAAAAAPPPPPARVRRVLKPPGSAPAAPSPSTGDDRQVLLDSAVEFAQMRARMQAGGGGTPPPPAPPRPSSPRPNARAALLGMLKNVVTKLKVTTTTGKDDGGGGEGGGGGGGEGGGGEGGDEAEDTYFDRLGEAASVTDAGGATDDVPPPPPLLAAPTAVNSVPPPRLAKGRPVTVMTPNGPACNLPDHRVIAGCTAVVALHCRRTRRLYVANAGDSRAVLCRAGGVAVALSEDHKPQHEGEAARIHAAGGYVNAVGRINGNLNLSRSLGDLKYKQVDGVPPEGQMITADPDVTVTELLPGDAFFVLGCDGVWDCLSNQQAVDLVRAGLQAGRSLVQVVDSVLAACLASDPRQTAGIGGDNITFMVVVLEEVEGDGGGTGDVMEKLTGAVAALGKDEMEEARLQKRELRFTLGDTFVE